MKLKGTAFTRAYTLLTEDGGEIRMHFQSNHFVVGVYRDDKLICESINRRLIDAWVDSMDKAREGKL